MPYAVISGVGSPEWVGPSCYSIKDEDMMLEEMTKLNSSDDV